jgi:alkylation response protein AidB-like acyl-CoA dehydrogenase
MSAVDRMDFEPTPEQEKLVERVATFARTAVGSLPSDAAGFATEACTALGAAGLLRERATLDAVLITVELARVSAALGATFASAWLFADALRRSGGSGVAALAAAAEAGTLLGSVILPVRRGSAAPARLVSETPEGVVLDGTTDAASLVPVASHALLLAAGAKERAVLASVDLSASGAKKAAPAAVLGLAQVPRGAVELARVVVPRTAILAENDAARDAARALVHARAILTAAVATGLAGSAASRAVSQVRASGKPSQATEFTLSDLATGYDAIFLATTHAAWQRDAGTDVAADSAAVKLLATRTATENCHGALTVCGEGGYAEDLRQAYLDARHLELYDGAEAEQIDVIASHMLGES